MLALGAPPLAYIAGGVGTARAQQEWNKMG